MFKKLILSVIIASSLFVTAQATDHNTISVYVDDAKIIFDSEPYLNNGYTMVPMRAIMEALGASVSWEENSKTATAIQNMNITKFTIGSHDYYRNGALQYMPVAAQQTNDRTYVPLRAISEGFGYSVEWDDITSTVYIYSQKESNPEENIYYIKGSNGGYLTLTQEGLATLSEPTYEGMWAIACADKDNNAFYIYNINNLETPLAYCNHDALRVIAEEKAKKEAEEKNSKKKKKKSEAEEEPVAQDSLCLCVEKAHSWTIEADGDLFRIYASDKTQSLDADKTDISENATVTLVPWASE